MTELSLDAFLAPISEGLGRPVPDAPAGSWDASRGLARERFADATPDELAALFTREAQAVGTIVRTAAPDELAQVVVDLARELGAGCVMVADDAHADAYGIMSAFDVAGVTAQRWDAPSGRAAVNACAQADVGVTFPFAAIAASGTVAQRCDAGSGRSVSLLPPAHIAVVAKSALVPRMIDVLERLDADPSLLSSSLVFITGPSATADIELVRVVGVHGPMQTACVLVDE